MIASSDVLLAWVPIVFVVVLPLAAWLDRREVKHWGRGYSDLGAELPPLDGWEGYPLPSVRDIRVLRPILQDPPVDASTWEGWPS